MEKKLNPIVSLSATILLLTLIFSGCEYDTPSEIYPIKGAPDPVITKVEPDSAVGGVLELKILGNNFAEHADQNIVYFGTNEAMVKHASATELKIMRPLKMSGTTMIKIAVRDAFVIAEYGPYKLEQGIVQLPAIGQVNTITIDKEENLYVDGDETIYRITPDGELIEYGKIDFISSAMRMGSGGYLYIQRKDNRDFYRIAPGGGSPERFTRIRKRANYFDFDQNGYIYSGSTQYGVCVTSPDGATSTELPGYTDTFQINAVRVYNGFVYIAADTITDDPASSFSGIWKLEIKGNGELGERILVYDWANAGDFSKSLISDITFSEDADLYVATDNLNPILIIHADGTAETLYAGTLETPATQICWGNGKYLYMNKLGREDKDSGISRIVMGKKGAPYYGRP